MDLIELLKEYSVLTVLFRLVLAAVLGGLIGLERGKHGHPAGLRTHMLVCLGSSMAMQVGLYMVDVMHYGSDPTRIGAQVVSGIGFLGVGTILVKGRDHITGLTTAATLWATAAMGLAVGVGFLVGAIGCTVVILVATAILYRFNSFSKVKMDLVVYAELNDITKVNDFYNSAKEIFGDISIHTVCSKSNLLNHIGLELIFNYKDCRKLKCSILEQIRSMNNVVYALEAN